MKANTLLMRGVTILLAFLNMLPFPATAAEGGAETTECREIISRLTRETGAQFDHFSPSRNNVFLKQPNMVLFCAARALTGVSLAWDVSGFPPNEWFNLAAKAGNAVTNVAIKNLETATHKCHRLALKDRSELAELEIPNAKVDCQAFTRDGGGVVLTIWINAKAN
jgi:hypothetical protein